MDLTIVKIKPNPVGKDRPLQSGPTVQQLAAEWVDFRNDSGKALSLENVALYHVAYSVSGQSTWSRIMTFNGVLQPGKVVRVHSGQVRETSVIRPEDLTGADYHIFTGRDAYVWNNSKGDRPRLKNEGSDGDIDHTFYSPNPPEGAVLVRVGQQLVAGQARAVNW